MRPTAEEILAKAACLVEESFAQGGIHANGPHGISQPGTYCIALALIEAGQGAHSMEYQRALSAVSREITGLHEFTLLVIDWNDVTGRTKEEAATAIRSAKRWLA